MSHESRPGFYLDKNGIWQQDRRKTLDRRRRGEDRSDGERRKLMRRKEDFTALEREHREMMAEALDEFEGNH